MSGKTAASLNVSVGSSSLCLCLLSHTAESTLKLRLLMSLRAIFKVHLTYLPCHSRDQPGTDPDVEEISASYSQLSESVKRRNFLSRSK